jgi:tetratricopeptide (TPR) repeat protein
VLAARFEEAERRGMLGDKLYHKALEIDPENLAAKLDQGQVRWVRDAKQGAEILESALELYPTNPELLHWYAHSIWSASWSDAEQILVLIVPYKPQEGDVLYDLACTRSLAGDLDGSVAYLRRAIDAGYRDFGHMASDPDMRNLRESGRLSEVLRENE